MANVFRHDISKILQFGFNIITHQTILTSLIRVTHKFFKLLSSYANGKVLKIQTNKLLKRKKKQKKTAEEEELEGMDYNPNEQEEEEEGEVERESEPE